MRFPLTALFLVLILGFGPGTVFAQGVLPGDRWPVRGTPLICGRAISQFVLFEQRTDRAADKDRSKLRVKAANLFVAVSQDKNGVFYHAANGIIDRSYRGSYLVPGGIYAHKMKPNTIFIYYGDARKPGWVLRPVEKPLPMAVLEKLRIGHFAGAPLKPAPKQ
jgi:hypothetical protein